MVIDEYEWHVIDNKAQPVFKQKIKEGKILGSLAKLAVPG